MSGCSYSRSLTHVEIHLHHERAGQDLPARLRCLSGHLALVSLRREDRRHRRERRPASRRCSGSWPVSTRILPARRRCRPATPWASWPRSRSSTPRRPCSGTSKRASRRCGRCSRASTKSTRSSARRLTPEEMDKVLEEQARVQDAIEAAGAWDLDSKLEHAMDALRLPPPDADVDQALRRRAPARRAVPAAAAVARSAPPRRADQPSRRRVGRLARALPARVQRVGRRDHARPLLPRQRRRLDPRARSHQGVSRGKATTPPGSTRSSSGWRSKRSRRPSGSGRCSASSSGSACRRERGRPRARRASTPTNNCWPKTRRRGSIASRSTFRPGRGSATSSSKRAICARATATCCSSTTSTSRCRAAASSA